MKRPVKILKDEDILPVLFRIYEGAIQHGSEDEQLKARRKILAEVQRQDRK